MSSQIQAIIAHNGYMLLDGGLGTEMEIRGLDLNQSLWSALHVDLNPDIITDIHRAYLQAGSDCIVSTSYQASFEGGRQLGMKEEEIAEWLIRSVNLAVNARDAFVAENQCAYNPLVGASIGPYGAFCADGSEYRGGYGLSYSELMEFHAQRWDIMANSNADIIVCETVPSFIEAEVLSDLFKSNPDKEGFISFTCRDAQHISDGHPLSDCVQLLSKIPNIVAIGVNCVPPGMIPDLIETIQGCTTELELAVYPNSGESYDGIEKTWSGKNESEDFGQMALQWFQYGARVLGGCCRTGPEHISKMKSALVSFIN